MDVMVANHSDNSSGFAQRRMNAGVRPILTGTADVAHSQERRSIVENPAKYRSS
jgi:hypothetical protein